MDFEKLTARAKAILLTPKTEWTVVAAEPDTVAGLYKNYIMILAAIPVLAMFVKNSLIGHSFFGVTVRTGFFSGVFGMLLSYALSLGVVYLLGLIINALAPTFGGEKNQLQALKTAAYALTAAWLAGIFVLLPWLGFLLMLAGGIYSIYLMFLGLPVTMRCPPEKAVGYTAVVIVIAFVLNLIIGAITAGLTMPNYTQSRSGSNSVTFDNDSTLGKLAMIGQNMEAAGKKMDAAKRSGDSQAQAEAASQALGAVLGGGTAVDALQPDTLKEFLPEKLAGLPRTSIEVERNGSMGVQVSTGKARYSDGERSLNLDITDMGGARGIMALSGLVDTESDKQTESGYEKTYRKDGRMIREEWNSNSESGKVSILIGQRFQVEVNGRKMSMEQIKSALSSLDLGRLEQLKDHGVKRG